MFLTVHSIYAYSCQFSNWYFILLIQHLLHLLFFLFHAAFQDKCDISAIDKVFIGTFCLSLYFFDTMMRGKKKNFRKFVACINCHKFYEMKECLTGINYSKR